MYVFYFTNRDILYRREWEHITKLAMLDLSTCFLFRSIRSPIFRAQQGFFNEYLLKAGLTVYYVWVATRWRSRVRNGDTWQLHAVRHTCINEVNLFLYISSGYSQSMSMPSKSRSLRYVATLRENSFIVSRLWTTCINPPMVASDPPTDSSVTKLGERSYWWRE